MPSGLEDAGHLPKPPVEIDEIAQSESDRDRVE